ncbi:MAG: adenosylcobalamin-dependent ribonucleoside-diphosphate reductase [Pyrobaculum sp.]
MLTQINSELKGIVDFYKNVKPSENAEKILRERYYWRSIEGEYLETKWQDICTRVARVVASAELVNNPKLKNYSDSQKLDLLKHAETVFYDLLASRVFIPNSPTLFNAGLGVPQHLLWKPIEQMTLQDYETVYKTRNHLHMLAACFVVPVEDSIEGIFEAIKEYAIITKSGGGVGSNFSTLRPANSLVAGTFGKASGPVSFMHAFNAAIATVEQGYKRRGALMGILNINHPDIEQFITAKENNDGERVLKFFNISVGIPFPKEQLKQLYIDDAEIELEHPKSSDRKRVNVRSIMRKIAENAWKTGDPGIVFLEEMNRYYALYPYRVIESTNPCGEIGLSAYEACNLGSIDLAKFVKDGQVCWDALANAVQLAVWFLDNIIDVSVYPLEKINQAVREARRIGLGIMGFSDMLYKLGIPYNSEEARQFAADLMAYFALHSHLASSQIAMVKGNFPLFDKSRYQLGSFMPFAAGKSKLDDELKRMFEEYKMYKRNVAVTTIAPTGSISNIADTSSGLEPNFLLAYIRYMQKSDGTKQALKYVNPVLKEALAKLPDADTLVDKIIEHGSLKNVSLPEDLKKVFVTALDISPMDHLLMQDAFQRYVDNNISKTINLPSSATVDDVLEIYLKALDTTVRGLTVYRDGSLQTQVLKAVKEDKTEPKVQFFIIDEHHKLRSKPRRETLRSVTRKFQTKNGTNYLTVSFDENNEAVEVFLANGSETAEIIGRLSSVALRAGVSLEEITKQLEKVKGEYAKTVAHEIKQAIEDFRNLWGEQNQQAYLTEDGVPKTREEIDKFVKANRLEWQDGMYVDQDGNTYCPSCLSKNSIKKQEGCTGCTKCGWSKCS